MPKDFYLDLADEVLAMCEELLRCAEEWHLPIRRKENFVGFGKMHGFYMFWIARKDGVDYFKARVEYAREQPQEIAYYPLTADNKDAILGAAETIYQEYLAHGGELDLSWTPRVKPLNLWKEVQAPVLDPGQKNQTPIHKSPWHEAARHAVSVWRGMMGEEEAIVPSGDLLRAAQAFSHTVDRLLQLLSDEIRVARTRDVWRRYVLTDAETLERIGTDYNLTRERIRQLVRKGNRAISAFFVRHCTHGTNEAFDTCVLSMTHALKNASCVLPVFLQNAFSDWGERKKKSALQLLFGEENGAELFDACERYRKMATAPAQKQDGAMEKVTRLQAMIQYPTEVCADTQEQISAFVMEREYTHVARFRRQLEKMKEYLHFVQKPNIVYYSTSKTDHRPDFLLELENGRRVLVLVLPTLNMAFSYNTKRFQALWDFCEKKGYGYLVVDDRGQTPCDLKRLPVDPILKSTLDTILLSKREILWDDILGVKEVHEVTNTLIAAYVLQNELHFVMDPYFCIRRSL